MAAIDIQNRTVSRRGRIYLHDITLKIERSQTWVFLGSNGSGKSRLAELIVSEGGEKTGLVSFEKEKTVIDREREEDMSDILDYPDPGRSASDFILERRNDGEYMKELARRFHFEGLLDRGLKFLSTGELRKVLIAEELMSRPELLILDEPYEGLDAASRKDLADLIDSLIEEGMTLVLLLNRLAEIPEEATHGGYLREGRLVLSGPRKEVFDSDNFQRLLHLNSPVPRDLPALPEHDRGLYQGPDLVIMKNIRASYGDNVVLRDFDWTVKRGEHWKISGPNGAGKSTLLSFVTGDNPQAYANDMTLFGMKRGSGETVWDIKKHIGYVSSALQRDYRVRITALLTVISGFHDSIGVYGRYSESEERTALEWLKLVRMDHRTAVPFQNLSYGEQRLILIVRAMVKHPPLLILDEPCQGLDEINRLMILRLIDIIAMESGTTVLYVTHHEEDRLESVKKHLKLNRKSSRIVEL